MDEYDESGASALSVHGCIFGFACASRTAEGTDVVQDGEAEFASLYVLLRTIVLACHSIVMFVQSRRKQCCEWVLPAAFIGANGPDYCGTSEKSAA